MKAKISPRVFPARGRRKCTLSWTRTDWSMQMRETSRGWDKKPIVNNNLKTAVLAKRLVARFGVRTIFIANKKALLDDAKEAFLDGMVGLKEERVGQIKDGVFGNFKMNAKTTEVPDLDFDIMVATIQSLHAKLNDERTRDKLIKWLRGVQFLEIDESQYIGTKTWDEVLAYIYAPYRVLLSATPKRLDGSTNLKLLACAGPVAFATTAKEQIAKGRLSEVKINYNVYDHGLYNYDDKDIEYDKAYRAWIVENDERTREYIIKPALKMITEGRHVLILFAWIDHGERIRDLLIESYVPEDQIRMITGSTRNEARKNAIKEFRKGEFTVMVGSTIFDAGVNIPIISGIVLAGAGNSENTLIQRIGRGVRTADYEEILGDLPEFMKKTDGHKVASVVDVWDKGVKFFENQSRKRYNTAREEFGTERVEVTGDIRRKRKMPEDLEVEINNGLSQEENEKRLADLEDLFEGKQMSINLGDDPNFEDMLDISNILDVFGKS